MPVMSLALRSSIHRFFRAHWRTIRWDWLFDHTDESSGQARVEALSVRGRRARGHAWGDCLSTSRTTPSWSTAHPGAARDDKRDAIAEDRPSILDWIGITRGAWLRLATEFETHFKPLDRSSW